MSAITQEQLIQFWKLIGQSKLISELSEQTSLTNNSNYLVINQGQDDAKKIKIPLIRGFKGSYNASTNTPSLSNGEGVSGDMYTVTVAGSRDFGNGFVSLLVDDVILYNGSKYIKLVQRQISDIIGLQNALDNKADLNGDVLETFKVADGTLTTHAVNKSQLDSAISDLQGALIPQGNWNADTNTPDISATTETGYYWIINLDGATDLGGITDWKINDWAVKTATGWAKIDNTDKVVSVAGKQGAVTLDLDDVSDSATRKALTTGAQTIEGSKYFSSPFKVNEGFSIEDNQSTEDGKASIIAEESEIFLIYGDNNGDFEMRIGEDIISLTDSNSNTAKLDFSNISTNRNYNFPNVSGIIALTSDINKSAIDALGINATELNGETKEDILENVNAKTLNQVSAQSLAFGESYINNYRSRLLDEGYTYFPNTSAYKYAQLKEQNTHNKASIMIAPSGVKESLIPAIKGLPLDFTRASTASYIDENGVMQTALLNVPRVTFDENGDESILIEPSRKNLFLNSETGVTQTITVVSGVDYAVSFSGTGSITFSGGATGTLSGTGANAVDRVSSIVTTSSTSVTCTITGNVEYVNFEINTDNSSVTYATSWIETLGTTVTRVVETVSKTGLQNYINSGEGVLYAEVKASAINMLDRRIAVSDGTESNRVFLYYAPVGGKVQAIIVSGGVTQVNEYLTGVSQTSLIKVAVSYKENESKVFVNGSQIGATDTSCITPIGLSRLGFDGGDGTEIFYGNCKDLRIYNQALTDAELIKLTSN